MRSVWGRGSSIGRVFARTERRAVGRSFATRDSGDKGLWLNATAQTKRDKRAALFAAGGPFLTEILHEQVPIYMLRAGAQSRTPRPTERREHLSTVSPEQCQAVHLWLATPWRRGEALKHIELEIRL